MTLKFRKIKKLDIDEEHVAKMILIKLFMQETGFEISTLNVNGENILNQQLQDSSNALL